ncbi:MAG: patatin-like phospholipase family protein [Bacillota bacterium]
MKDYFLSGIIICLVITCSGQVIARQNISEIKLAEETYLVEENNRFTNLDKPTVAIALGGGGARAFVNIGVIKALEEENIPIDFIVGTSMGAIIGTMYGSGISVYQMEEILKKLPFKDLFDLNSNLNKSLLKTEKVNKFMEEIAPNKSLEEFPIPTALLSFDLTSGHKYLSTTGSIEDVLQSSYSIPFYFPVKKSNNRYLMDPGILEMSPAKSARVLGADFVITTTAFDKLPYQEYNNSFKSAARFLTLVQERNSMDIINNYSDIVIDTDVGDFSFMDFGIANKLIDLGYYQTKEKLVEIKEGLNKSGIQLQEQDFSQTINYSDTLNDLKYNRQLLNDLKLNPLLYYGRDYSLFNSNLLRSSLKEIQYGFELEKNRLEIIALAKQNIEKELEIKMRLKKLQDNLDLIVKSRINQEDIVDGKLGFKYYADDYTLELGAASLAKENYAYLDNSFNWELDNLNWQGENNFIISSLSNLSLLTTQKIDFSLSSIWQVTPKFIYNSSERLDSPIIYRGVDRNNKANFQGAIDFSYNHQLISSIELAQIFQMTNIGLYSFIDYQSLGSKSWATGIGFKADFNLLGLKPVDLRTYSAYSLEDEQINSNININYSF